MDPVILGLAQPVPRTQHALAPKPGPPSESEQLGPRDAAEAAPEDDVSGYSFAE